MVEALERDAPIDGARRGGRQGARYFPKLTRQVAPLAGRTCARGTYEAALSWGILE